jgi:hypothetical protein
MSNALGKDFGGNASIVSLYNGTGGDLVVGEVVVIAYDDAAGAELCVATAATIAAPGVRTAVAAEAVTDDTFGLFYVGGLCQALVNGTTDVDAGDFLEVINGADNFIKDGTSRAITSAAVAVEAYTDATDALKWVVLIPEQHTIAGS